DGADLREGRRNPACWIEQLMAGVFCSFTGADFDFAHDLALAIADESFPVWFDRFRIKEVGVRLTPEIEQAIEESNCLVVVVSAAAHESAWVQKEVNIAQQRQRPVFQVVI